MEAGQEERPQAAAPRAFQALSFEEEKHAIIAEAHRTIALQCRLQHLRSNGGSSDQIQETLNKCIKAGEELRENIMGASRALWSDWESMEAVLSIAEFQRDCTIAGRVLETWPGAWKLVDSSLFSDRGVMLKIIARHGWWLRYATQQLQEDREVVMAAVASDGRALEFASAALRADKQVVLTAARSNTYRPDFSGMLRFASEELLSDKEVAFAAVATDPMNIIYAGDVLKGDREVGFAALGNYRRRWSSPSILAALSPELRADRELVLQALRLNSFALRFASDELKRDEDFILLAMRSTPRAQWKLLFDEAKSYKSFTYFREAAETSLAVQGERAPVVTVTLGNGTDSQQEQESPSFEVRLLSGVSFHCSFPMGVGFDDGWGGRGEDDESVSDSSFEHSDEEEGDGEPGDGQNSADEDGAARDGDDDEGNQGTQHEAPPLKRPRLASPEVQSAKPASGNLWAGRNVGQLAKLVVQELPKHMEADPPAERVFLQ